ncbi:hypothetical protein KJ359_006552 [Pestalotiopsis sp. 9143b]|nr:hypothetical protein KJ359_006552 [Pestalotiopsis sp. 9143b]
MPSQITSPVPITPTRKGMRLVTSEALFASLNETLASSSNGTTAANAAAPVRGIKERDWDVPAPPPPSPVSFHHHHHHHDQWRGSVHR